MIIRRHILALAWGALIVVAAAADAAAQAPAAAPSLAVTTGFGSLAGQLTAARDEGTGETESLQEQALGILDRAALEQLNRAKPDLDALNTALAGFVTHQPAVGEGYRVVRLGGEPAAYALLADFGLSGPSAVRVYAGGAGHLALAGRVDRYAQKDFFDDYMEIVPLAGNAPVFVTVAGRADEQQTGVFTAWVFSGVQVRAVWTSDIVQNSSYAASADGFRLTYCSLTDPEQPTTCQSMQRDRYVWQDQAWKRVETAPVSVNEHPQ